MSVQTAVMGQLDRMAKIRQNALALALTGTDFWDRIDAAENETYENRVKGSEATALDAALAAATVLGPTFLSWFSLHNTYVQSDLALTGTSMLEAYLDTIRQRVPFEAGELLVDAMGSPSRLTAHHVFPKGTLPAGGATPAASGMHCFETLLGTAGASTEVVVDGALSAYVGGAVILVENMTATSSVTDLIMDCTRLDDTLVPLTVVLGADTIYKQSPQFAGAVDTSAAAGQKVVAIKTSTAQFKAAEWVLIVKAGGVEEFHQVDSVAAGAITLETDLIQTLADNDAVYPTFKNVVWKSGTVANTKSLYFYALPDRTIAL